LTVKSDREFLRRARSHGGQTAEHSKPDHAVPLLAEVKFAGVIDMPSVIAIAGLVMFVLR